MWHGDYRFLLKSLVLKDFRVRYRNMSLGVFWSLLNPLVMMGVLTFIFTKIFAYNIPHFALFVLCGMVPFNFFSLAWVVGTTSVLDNAALIKRVGMPREAVPMSSVISTCLHLLIQILLLAVFVLASGLSLNVQWFWLPMVWCLEIVFVYGLVLATSAVNVFVRDTRYIVESANAVLFWLVPIFYDFSLIPERFRNLYQFNPVAALVLAMRHIVLEAKAPPTSLLWKLALVAVVSVAVGHLIFGRLKHQFYEHL